MALCRAGRMAVVVRGHSEQFGRDAVALVESASFPNGQVVADPGISRSSLQAWLREGPACLARPVALARSHAIAPPWAPPRPDGRRPAWAYMRASKTYGAAERPATASAGRRLQACQPTRCRQPARLGPSTGAIIHLRSRIPVPHGGFHGYDHNPRTRPLPWKPPETAPRAQPRGPSFRPRLELIRAFLLTGLDPIDLHNIPPKSHKHRTLQGAPVSLSSFRVKSACVSHRQRREPPGTADELVWRQLPPCD